MAIAKVTCNLSALAISISTVFQLDHESRHFPLIQCTSHASSSLYSN